jgi:hypothetical protein
VCSSVWGTATCFGLRGQSCRRGCGRGFGLLGERVRRRPTHCVVNEVHPEIVFSWSGRSSAICCIFSDVATLAVAAVDTAAGRKIGHRRGPRNQVVW